MKLFGSSNGIGIGIFPLSLRLLYFYSWLELLLSYHKNLEFLVIDLIRRCRHSLEIYRCLVQSSRFFIKPENYSTPYFFGCITFQQILHRLTWNGEMKLDRRCGSTVTFTEENLILMMTYNKWLFKTIFVLYEISLKYIISEKI